MKHPPYFTLAVDAVSWSARNGQSSQATPPSDTSSEPRAGKGRPCSCACLTGKAGAPTRWPAAEGTVTVASSTTTTTTTTTTLLRQPRAESPLPSARLSGKAATGDTIFIATAAALYAVAGSTSPGSNLKSDPPRPELLGHTPRALLADIKEEESSRCYNFHDQRQYGDQDKLSMSQRASAPRPVSHHRSSSDAKLPPISPQAANAPRAGAVRLSPNLSQDGEPGRLFRRDEHHGMLPAGRGNSTTDDYTKHYDNSADRDTARDRDSRPTSTANSPGGTTAAAGPSAVPRTISSAMAPERDEGPMDNTPPSTMAAAATAALAASTDERSAQSTSSRNFGVHNILNPSEAQGVAHSPLSSMPRTASRRNDNIDSGESRKLPRTRPSSASSPRIGSSSSMTTNYLGRQQQPGNIPQPYGFQAGSSGASRLPHSSTGSATVNYDPGYGQPNPPADASQPPNASTQSPGMGFVPLSSAAGLDQESSPQPGYAHPNSSLGPPPRRILTPKSPRRSSLGRPMPGMGAPGSQHPLFSRSADAPPIPPLPPTMLHQSMSAPNVALGSGPGSGQGSGTGPSSGPMPGSVPGSYFPPHAAPGPPPGMLAGDSPQRSFSQPYYSRDAGGHGDNHGSHSHTPEAQPAVPASRDTHQQQQQDQQPPRFPLPPGHRPQGDYANNPPSNRIVSAGSGNTGDSESPWGAQEAPGGAGGGRSMSMSEGQQFITITPSFGEEIHVPVDIHQASKQADEKRLRNAGASARFRARKKEKDREVQLGIQRLESINRELQKRNQELEAQREFYRNERNRLRHLMAQTPNMREYAESGPPSPVSAYSSLSYVPDSNSMSGGSNTPHPQQAPQPLLARPHLHKQPPPPQQQRPYPHQHTPSHSQAPLYPPMSTAPDYSGPESSSAGMERPSQRRRTDSGPNIEYYTPSYTTSAPPPPTLSTTLPSTLPSSLPPPLPPAGPSSRFRSMSPSPLSGSPSNPRLPPLRLDTPGSNPGSVGVGGGMATGPPTPEAGHSVSALPVPHYPTGTTAPSAYSRSYDTAGWAADAPSPHTQDLPPDPKHQR